MTVLTIVTVNLNDAEGLRTTAASVATQPRGQVEWLVMDGGSTDGSRAVIEAQGDLVDGWRSARDGGVYDAMNRGLLAATGRYVVFLNSGDRFAAPGILGSVLPILERPDAPDLLFADAALALRGGRLHIRPARPPAAYLHFGLPACHQATFIRRSAHLRHLYDLSYAVTADYALVATLLVGGATSACLSLPVAVRQCHRASLSERHWATRIREACRVHREVLGLPPGVRLAAFLRLCLTHAAYVALRDLPRIRPRSTSLTGERGHALLRTVF